MIGLNRVKTWILIAALGGLFVLIGGAIGGQSGLVIALAIALVFNFSMYWFSDKIAIATTRSKPVTEQEAPELYRIVRELTQINQMPMPRIYVSDMMQPNAFATGRNPQHAVVAVTRGILEILDERELRGVLAHELSHVKNRDVLISTIAATLAGAITYLAHMAQFAAMFGGGRHDDEEGGGSNPFAMILMAVLAPIAAMLVQMAVSRSREFQADATGARVAGKTWGLAKALEKLHMAQQVAPMAANPATAHLFIVNPLSGRSLMNLFSTHPPLEERIARLRSMRIMQG